MLFLPDAFLAYFFLDSSLGGYRSVAGVAFILSCSLLLVHLAVAVWRILTPSFLAFRAKRKIKNWLKSGRTQQEVSVLQPFIMQQVKTRTLPLYDGTVRELQARGILIASGGQAEMNDNGVFVTHFNMMDWVWTYLSANPAIIGLEIKDGNFTRIKKKKAA